MTDSVMRDARLMLRQQFPIEHILDAARIGEQADRIAGVARIDAMRGLAGGDVAVLGALGILPG